MVLTEAQFPTVSELLQGSNRVHSLHTFKLLNSEFWNLIIRKKLQADRHSTVTISVAFFEYKLSELSFLFFNTGSTTSEQHVYKKRNIMLDNLFFKLPVETDRHMVLLTVKELT